MNFSASFGGPPCRVPGPEKFPAGSATFRRAGSGCPCRRNRRGTIPRHCRAYRKARTCSARNSRHPAWRRAVVTREVAAESMIRVVVEHLPLRFFRQRVMISLREFAGLVLAVVELVDEGHGAFPRNAFNRQIGAAEITRIVAGHRLEIALADQIFPAQNPPPSGIQTIGIPQAAMKSLPCGIVTDLFTLPKSGR